VPRQAMRITDGQDRRLHLRTLRLDDYLSAAWTPPRQPLAAILHGDFEPPERSWPQVRGPFSPLDGIDRVEVFLTPEPARRLPHPNFAIGVTEDLLFAAFTGHDERPIVDQAAWIYCELLELVKKAGFPHLLRIWHAIPRIHEHEDGLERYRQFCLGRQKAFTNHGPAQPSRFPAASVLGTSQGSLNLFALAAKAPGLAVENPSQVSAYRYPPIHGPCSPSFSRALVTGAAGEGLLFLSGTASITGHESRHLNQITAQVHQTLDNLDTLIETASTVSSNQFSITAGEATLRAYVRARDDFETARAGVEARLGQEIDVLYLEADICRQELLFEMDGVIAAQDGVIAAQDGVIAAQ